MPLTPGPMSRPAPVLALAMIYHHRATAFYAAQPPGALAAAGAARTASAPLQTPHMQPLLLMAACLHLACKQAEVVRKVRDIVNVLAWATRGEEMSIEDVSEDAGPGAKPPSFGGAGGTRHR